MKVRYDTRCPRCNLWMRAGAIGVRYARAIWHPDCLAQYLAHRKALVATGE